MKEWTVCDFFNDTVPISSPHRKADCIQLHRQWMHHTLIISPNRHYWQMRSLLHWLLLARSHRSDETLFWVKKISIHDPFCSWYITIWSLFVWRLTSSLVLQFLHNLWRIPTTCREVLIWINRTYVVDWFTIPWGCTSLHHIAYLHSSPLFQSIECLPKFTFQAAYHVYILDET